MIYKLEKILNGISHFSILNTKVTFVKNDKFYVDTNEFNILPMIYNGDITNDNIWIKDINWDNYLITLSNNHCARLDFNLGINGVITDTITIFKDNILSCYSTIEKKVIINFPKIEKIKTYLSTKNNLIFQVETNLKSLSLLTGEYEWEIDLSTIVKAEANWRVEKILGIAHELLIISIEQPDALTQALALNVHTGALVWYIPHGMHTNATFQLSADVSRLVSITWNHLIEIDTATGTILRDKALDDFVLGKDYRKPIYQGRVVMMIQGKLVGDYYYFVGYDWLKGSSWRYDILGVFNWRTEQIEWVHDFEFTGRQSLLNTPEVTDNKLYILDNASNLYIFEKEPTT